ncbi:PEP-CTERM system TPR-repeat protein PrsT [Colwellia sp. 1_MG-2023]|uniref:XrtA/PEP-CTERM system TPR-repeat protein PrsT n=1 Tax=Colwellia sp. 1_MG-2023 TaxID=3062649 RepID=UPI0026E449EB|nr:XrtA/PEP-CTERM system TPR-repeat protein PrsT [Colwellia sp. 1_MG-2023]MDO6444996.1 PEP-CTERM system TPR-repeat protein PrsT [Colwellia sp. 1_MG-2023]
MRLINYRLSILIPIIFTIGCGKLSIEEQMKNAEAEFNNNNYNTVIIQMKNIIKEQPENKNARLLLAHSNYSVGLFVDAEKEYLKAQSLGVDLNEFATNYMNSLYGIDDFIGIIDFWTQHSTELTLQSKAEISPVLSIAYLNQKDFQKSFDTANQGKLFAKETNNNKLIEVNMAYASTFDKSTDLTDKINQLSTVCDAYPQEWIMCNLLANSLYTEKRFSEAAIVYETILQNKPNFNQLVFKLADSHVRAKNYDDAEPFISSLLKTYPKQPYVNLLSATIAMNKGNYSRALEHINTTLNQNYKSPQARLIAGVIHYQLENFEQANSQLRGLISNYQNNPVVTKLYIATQLKLGNSEAMYSLIDQVDTSEDNSELFVNLSLELLNLGEEEKSKSVLKTIDTSLIENQQILRNISLMKLKSGDASGINDLEQALQNAINAQASPKEINNNKLLLISSLIALKDNLKAEKYVDAWIKDSPNNVENYQLLAEIEKQKEPVSISKLDEIYTLILSKDKNNTNANIYFGATALQNQKYDLAKQHYQTAFTTSPTNISALKGFYIANSNINTPDDIEKIVASALSDFQSNHQQRLVLAQFYLLSSKPEQAITLLENAKLDNKINKDEVNLIIGEALLQSKQFTKAIQLYKEMLNNDVTNIVAMEKILSAYKKSNDLNGAVETFEALNQKYPNDLQVGLSLASVYIYTSKKNRSLTFINSLSPEQQTSPIVRGIKGKALYAINQFQDALDELLISYEQLPDSATIRYIFDSYIKLNNSQDAIKHMGAHIEKYPNDLVNRVYFANELVKQNKEKAIEQYEYILNKDMKNIIVLNNIAWLLFEKGKLQEAKKYIDKALQYSPENPDIIDTFNQISEALKN